MPDLRDELRAVWEVETTIAGIPCIAEVVHYDAGRPAILDGSPDLWAPEGPEELEYRVLDRRGRPAPWLARKATRADDTRIIEELKHCSNQ